MSIEVKNLTKIYGAQKAVDNISFRIGKGEIVGFLGPNGAGKSTTMKLITGYLQPDAGNTIVGGINMQENPIEGKRKIGYLPEANPLYYDMYVREYLDFTADVHHIKNKKQKIADIIETVGLTAESNKKTGALSKGYKQRVGLAAALLHDPETLILDEPTTGLDPNQIVEIRAVIRKLGKDKTVLFSSHIMQEVEAVCDRAIIINKGRLVADDKLDNLQKTGSVSHFVLVQFQEPVEQGILQSITGMIAMEILPGDRYRFQTHDPERTRKEIMENALRHNLNIVSLQTVMHSLEEVFRNLTGNEPGNANQDT
ncbi:MAG: gliding motility-associated ABC transporter ATP-binding subunit GldA [Chitinophagaceae bacterium]|nr:gliding motility-associated ABC transporter ATP-binding subunit GldA [Chitinophagaceae bacterium]